MTSKIDICNLALGYLGQYPISSLEQENAPARWFNLFYNPVRDEVLRTHNWAFATAEKPLIPVQATLAGPGQWAYKYPADALFVRRVFTPVGVQKPLPFEERLDSAQGVRVLITQAPQARVVYTRRVQDETQYDASFVKCLALALACDMAPALTGDITLAARLEQKYALYVEEARRSNMTENCVLAPQSDAFSEVR